MSDDLTPVLSGVDLARVALTAAKNRPADAAAGTAATGRVKPSRRTGRRDPITFSTAIGTLVTEHAWETPAAAGSITDQWADIAPELVGKISLPARAGRRAGAGVGAPADGGVPALHPRHSQWTSTV
ncbi:hypothetical protein ACIPJQ_38780 [Streptomyces griseoviridis]